jgi:hypothetical protein
VTAMPTLSQGWRSQEVTCTPALIRKGWCPGPGGERDKQCDDPHCLWGGHEHGHGAAGQCPVDMESMDQDTCLVQDRSGSDLMTTGQVFLVPDSSICRGQGKRKTAKEDASLPVEDYVSLLSTQSSTTAVGAAPRTDTLAQLLAPQQ